MNALIDVVREEPGYLNIFFKGNLVGEDAVRKLEEAILDELQNDDTKLHLHMQRVSYMTSAGLAMLIKLLTKMTVVSGSLVLSGVTPPVYRLFEITRLHTVFTIQD